MHPSSGFQSFIEGTPYVGLFVILLACGVGLPLPEDVPLILSGLALHHGYAHNVAGMIAVGMLGVLCGDTALYTLGRIFGEHIVEHRFLRWLATPTRIDWAERQFARRGPIFVMAARFMPGARAVLYMTAGIFKVQYWKFLLFDGLAASISVPTWILLAYKFGEAVEGHAAKRGKIFTLLVIATLLVGWGLWEWWQHVRRKREEIARILSNPPHAHPSQSGDCADPAARSSAAATPSASPSSDRDASARESLSTRR